MEYTIYFTRNAIYEESGYINIGADNAEEAKVKASELLRNGADACDYDGDIFDFEFVKDAPISNSNVVISDVEELEEDC